MYRRFFGFSERPFRLVPDPDYLFLSRSHEEALCHLKYAADHGEGFVLITGEVGCGKTMLCRAFLEGLDPDTESAYIFNPKMDAYDLLCAINDEFGIPARGSTKELIDTLNRFLMEKRAEGKKVILIIDEAQNLTKDVLEQIRLLSNLETTKQKLFQIILAGQPELAEMLDSHELRQLAQRMSLSCVLNPLSRRETRAYIEHRLLVASKKPKKLFSRAAISKIYRYSGGIPRLINISCDRALLVAYGLNSRKISGRIASLAVKELSQRGKEHPKKEGNLFKALILACLVLIFGIVFLKGSTMPGLSALFRPKQATDQNTRFSTPKKEVPSKSARPPAPLPAGERAPADTRKEKTEMPGDMAGIGKKDIKKNRVLQKIMNREEFAGLLESPAMRDSRQKSAAFLLSRWKTGDYMPEPVLKNIEQVKDDGLFASPSKDDEKFFSSLGKRNGLETRIIDGDLDLVLNLGLCAVFKFSSPENGENVYLTITGTTPKGLVFSSPNRPDGPDVFTIPADAMIRYWTGKAFIFWKNFYNYKGIIPTSSPGESVITLKIVLRKMGYKQVAISPAYDSLTRSIIKTIQAAHHIPADGYVGPLTQIVLYNDNPDLSIPRLKKFDQPGVNK